MVETRRYQILDGPLSIRDAAGGNRTGQSLSQGQQITVTGEPVIEGGYIWVNHSVGWSALGTDDETEMYMIDITDRDPSEPRRFKIWTNILSIRDAANGTRLPDKLYQNDEIEVVADSLTQTGGYIWWQHDKGWSAERNIAGNNIYMKEVFAKSEDDIKPETSTDPQPDTPVVTVTEQPKTGIPDTWKGILNLQVAQSVKVRAEPSTNPRGLIIRTVAKGDLLRCNMDSLTTSDGYIWVQHDFGWSAIQNVAGDLVFLVEPGSIPGLIAIGPDGPAAEDLPGYRQLFSALPVQLDDIQWFQYFGNNMFAMRNGANYGYDRYSQGMHGGLDFGNSIRPKPVYAGIEAEFVKVDYSRRNNYKVVLKKDDYTIIYQHITQARQFSAGDIIKPDTQLAMIEHHSINNGWDHLHLEVRFMGSWIINPLLLMQESIYNALLARFDPDKLNTGYNDFPKSKKNFFYHTPTWSKWVTPLDQPMIKLAGPVIGPRGELDKSEW